MLKSVMITRIASVAIIVGSVAYCKYQQYALEREMNDFRKKMQDDQERINEAFKNLGKF